MTCTKQQIKLLRKYAVGYTEEAAAAKGGMAYSTAKRYLSSKKNTDRVAKVPVARNWKIRQDAFAEVWLELKQLLKDWKRRPSWIG